jgi:hypothetical protein
MSIVVRLLVLVASACLWAQTEGALTGRVLDPSGAPVAQAGVLIRSPLTGLERRVISNAQGRYLAWGLPPGRYRLEVTRPGFQTAVREDVELDAGRVRDADFQLRIGAVSEAVTVTDATRLVDTSASVFGAAITKQQLTQLPLNGRDLFELVAQQPGANVATSALRTINSGLGARLSVNGQRLNQNGFQLDGIRMNESSGAAPASAAGLLLGLEGIAELRVVTNPFSAEYGRAAGGVFTAVSRSGTNRWHGSLYEFLRNSATDARNYFDAPNQKIPPFRRNQFGGLLTGPVRRDRMFFTANYEGLREALTQTARPTTISAAARTGDLPGRRVTVAPGVRPFLELYPLPNGRDFGDGTGEFISTLSTHTEENYGAGKLDFHLGDRLRAFGRYTSSAGQRATPDPFQVWDVVARSRYHFLHAGLQYVASPRTVHDFRLGFSRVVNAEQANVRPGPGRSLSFAPGRPLGAIEVTGLTELGGVSIRIQPRRYALNDYQFNYTVTRVAGAHRTTAGASFDRVQLNQISDNVSSGFYRFTSLANFLQGITRNFDIMLPGSDSVRGWRQNLFAGFVQDDWRWHARLSVALGVRYETYSTPVEVNGKIATLRDPVQDRAVTVGGPLFENPSRRNFAPRASLAWDVTGRGRTLLRAGAGIFFDLLSTRELIIAGTRMPPFFRRTLVNNPPFPNGLAALAGGSVNETIDTLDYRPSQPYVAQFQLFLEHQMGGRTLVRAGYVGSRGVHLPGQMSNFNLALPQTLPDGRLFFAANAPLRNPALGQVGIRLTNFDSNYHGLQTALETGWRSRVRAQFKYTFSKSIDNSSRAIFNEFQTPDRMPMVYNYRLNRAVSDFDAPHSFAANGSVSLPGPRRGWLRHVAAGWDLHALAQLQSGAPFYPSVGFDRARIRAVTQDLGQRPDFLGGNVITGNPRQWFNPLAFGLPEAGFYGNLGRNTLRGPGLAFTSAALHKALWATERHQLRLRAEFFNVLNRPNLQVPSDLQLFDSTGQRVGSAGRISETATTARQMQLALRWEF